MANLQAQEPVSYTVETAAQALMGRMDKILGEEPDQDEPDDDDEADEAEPVEQDAEEPEAEASDDAEESADDGEPEESISLETLDDVAKALGVDSDQLMANLKMRVKVNGVEELISLAEAQKGNQLERDYRHKTAEIAEQRRAMQAEREQSLSQLHQAAAEAHAALQFAEQAIYAEINTPQMAELRQTNPAEWVARQQEAQGKWAALQQTRNHAQQQLAGAMQAQQAQQQRYLAAHLEEQANHLKAKVSDWSDEKRNGVSKFLQERYGYNEKEIGGVLDHRLILMALDAQAGAQARTETAEVVKKVIKSTPKLQPPGKPKSAIQVKAKHIAGLKGRLKQTGHIRDAAKVIEALL